MKTVRGCFAARKFVSSDSGYWCPRLGLAPSTAKPAIGASAQEAPTEALPSLVVPRA